MRRRIIVAALLAGSAVFALLAFLSLGWRTQHDTPLMLYVAWMLDAHGAVPYRDLVDMNLPGTYLVNLVVGRLSGYSDLGVRIADLALLSGILGATYVAMGRFGRLVAWTAALLFGLFVVGSGPWMSLQRELILLLPLSWALALVSTRDPARPHPTAFMAGLLLGCAATVKPHALLGAPPLLVFLWLGVAGKQSRRGFLARGPTLCGAAAAGGLIPVALAAAWISGTGAGPAFQELYSRYGPIYASVNGMHRTMFGAEWQPYLLRRLLDFGDGLPWLLSAFVGGGLAAAYHVGQRRFVALLWVLLLTYSASVVLQGRFFAYHWLLAHYFALLLSSLCLVEWRGAEERVPAFGLVPVAALVFVALNALPLHVDLRTQLRGEPLPPPKKGRPDKIAAFLKDRLRPGDLVQPLDVTGGAVHGLLLARGKLATSFLYDSFFYVRVSDPFVQELRHRFLEEMAARRPRFVVDVWGPDKPWVQGVDTSRDFPELRRLLDRDYEPVGGAIGTTFYERRASPSF